MGGGGVAEGAGMVGPELGQVGTPADGEEPGAIVPSGMGTVVRVSNDSHLKEYDDVSNINESYMDPHTNLTNFYILYSKLLH